MCFLQSGDNAVGGGRRPRARPPALGSAVSFPPQAGEQRQRARGRLGRRARRVRRARGRGARAHVGPRAPALLVARRAPAQLQGLAALAPPETRGASRGRLLLHGPG